MGGTVALTIRKSNGQILKMAAHTNTLKSIILNNSFLIESESSFNALLLPWKKHVADWKENKHNGNFDDIRTHWYAPHGKLAPYNYGLIVVDFINREILSAQNYTRFDSLISSTPIIECATLLSSQNKRHVDESAVYAISKQKNTALKQLYDMFQAGSVNTITYPVYEKINGEYEYEDSKLLDVSNMTFTEIMDFCFEKENSYSHMKKNLPNTSVSSFNINPGRFNIVNFDPWSIEDAEKLKSHLLNNKFTINSSENYRWNEWFKKISTQEELKAS